MGLSSIHQHILVILQSHPGGIDIKEVRAILGLPPDEQEHLNRRLRDLYPLHIIERRRDGKRTIYLYKGPRPEGEWEYADVSKALKARVLAEAHGRCAMCGRTASEDKVRIHIDHKIPKEWGGKSEWENLQALCSSCNEGKRNFFASFDPSVMKKVVTFESVHVRIGELLKLFFLKPVASDLISIVASAIEYQEDWQKRLRELRYLGWEIEVTRQKVDGRVKTSYTLKKFLPWPDNPTKHIKDYERRSK